MSRLRHNTPGISQRMRALAMAQRQGIDLEAGPDFTCARTELGQRLGIAAIYGGQGDADNARAAALLAVAGVEDSVEARAAVLGVIGHIAGTVRLAAGVQGGRDVPH